MVVAADAALAGFAPPDEVLLDRFAALVGDRNSRRADEAAAFLNDERALFHGTTPLVLLPVSTQQVADILALASATRTAIVPQGGATGLVGGHLPHANGVEIIVSTQKLNAIRALDPVGRTMVVEAGVTLEMAQQAAERHDLMFPLNIGSKGSCSIGGLLSTNAGGTQALCHGMARDQMLGLEVVLADGRIWHGLRALKKDNTGYDLRHLFAGAEGTLGIITAAVMRLVPRPRQFEAAWVGLQSPADALRLLQLAEKRAGSALMGCELMPRMLLDFLLRHATGARDPLTSPHPWYVLLDIGLFGTSGGIMADLLEEAFEQGFVSDAAVAETLQQRDRFWWMRETMSMVQRHEGGSIKHDIAVPVARIADFIAEGTALLEQAIPGCRPVPFGHLGDGNLHFNVTQPAGADKAGFLARWEEINALIHALVARFGGSISAEHGIGRLKRDLLPQVKDPVEMQMMRAIKATLDPQGILNPGKVL